MIILKRLSIIVCVVAFFLGIIIKKHKNINNGHGPTRTAQFLSDTQRLVNRWLMHRGFSIRLSDCEPSKETKEKVAMTIRLAEEKVRRILSIDAIARSPDEFAHKLSSERIESTLSDISNRVLTNVGKVVHASLDEDKNALYQAVLCASKGNLINIAQLLGCIGQTSVEGRRVFVSDPQGQFGEAGTLAKCGFVSRSYFEGLSSTEFFFHTMAGREGLIDTAVKTANTGYLQRRLMKAMETLTIAYDYTVRNAKQTIIQFSYGADSFDATFVFRQTLTFLFTPLDTLKSSFQAGDEWEKFKESLLLLRLLRSRTQGEPDALAYCPGSIRDIVFTFRNHACNKAGNGCDASDEPLPPLTPASIISDVNKLCVECCATRWGKRVCYEALIRWSLRYSIVADLTPLAFTRILNEIQRRTQSALVAPGEAVGALSAQSISEPLTQLTLNTRSLLPFTDPPLYWHHFYRLSPFTDSPLLQTLPLYGQYLFAPPLLTLPFTDPPLY